MVLKVLYKATDTASTHTELIMKITLFLRLSNFGDEDEHLRSITTVRHHYHLTP